MKHEHLSFRRARQMKILASYHFKIQYKSEKKMTHADYFLRLYHGQIEYPQNRKDAKFILNILYTKEGIYGSKRYKDFMKGLIQVSYRKVNKKEISYQTVCRETKEEIELYTALKYFTKNDKFNCNLQTLWDKNYHNGQNQKKIDYRSFINGQNGIY